MTNDRKVQASPGSAGLVRLRTWLQFYRLYRMADKHLRRRLHESFGTTSVRFDILYTLKMHPEGLSMGDLSVALLVTNGNISAIVRDLAEKGYIRFDPALTDRRSMIATITPEGEVYVDQISLAHNAWVEELMADMSNSQVQQLSESLRALKKSLSNRI